MFLTVPLYAEEYRTVPLYPEKYKGEIEVGTMRPFVATIMEENLFVLDLPVAYRYRISPNISAGLGITTRLAAVSNGFSSLSLSFLGGPSLRVKIEEGSSPYVDLNTEFGVSYYEIEEYSDTFFTFSISPVIGYIFNIKCIDIGIGFSYSFFYTDTPNSEEDSYLGIVFSLTFLHK